MTESQHTEWNASWRDDYLRWVCGFANAEGGVLLIGRDDRGRAVGLPDARHLPQGGGARADTALRGERCLDRVPGPPHDYLELLRGVPLKASVKTAAALLELLRRNCSPERTDRFHAETRRARRRGQGNE